MRQFYHLWSTNIKRKHGLNIVFIVIMALSILLMNIGLVTWHNLEAAFLEKCESTNSAHIVSVMSQESKKTMDNYFDSEDSIAWIDTKECLYTYAEYDFGKSNLSSYITIMQTGDSRTIEKISYVEKSKVIEKNQIYLPLIFKTSALYKVGDKFTLNINNEKFTYKVGGFFEDMLLGTNNSGLISFLLNQEEYNNLNKNTQLSLNGRTVFIQLNDIDEIDKISKNIFNYSIQNIKNPANITTINRNSVSSARCNTGLIISAILLAFSIIILVIALLIIYYKITDYITENIVNFGILKALGYQNLTIINSVIVQFIFMITISLILGIIASLIIIPYFSNALATQSGMIWNQKLDVEVLVLIGTIAFASTSIIAYLSIRKIKKIFPLQALNNNKSVTSNKHNFLPFEKSRIKPLLLLSFKYTMNNIRQNLSILLVYIGIGFVSVFSVFLFYNTVINNSNFVKSAIGVFGDVQIIQSTEKDTYIEDFDEKLKNIESTDTVVYFGYEKAFCKNQELFTYVCNNFNDLDSNLCFKGNYPKNKDEIAISGLVAEKFKKSIGDTITVTYGKKANDYVITGLIQSAYSTGYECGLTLDGYSAIYDGYRPYQLLVYLDDDDIDNYIDIVLQKYSSNIINCTDYMKNINSFVGTYVEILSALTFCVIFITMLISVLVLYLVVSSMISRMYKQLGIQKALGYSGGQLIAQISISFAPAILIGTFLGGILAYIASEYIISALLYTVGISRMKLITDIKMMFANFGCILLLSYFVIYIVSLKIRSISVLSLINKE